MSIPSIPKILLGACAALLAVTVSAAPGTVQPAAPAPAASQAESDCSRIYGGQHVSCSRVACSEEYRPSIGTWRGEFSSYVREKSKPGEPVFRPYHDTITYAPDACFTNPENGDAFIVGHMTDVYPAFAGLPAREDTGLLVTGVHGDQTPFLRTVGRDGAQEFALTYRNRAARLAIWSLHIPGANQSPQMSYTTIDARDWEAADRDRRAVIVTLTVGPDEHPLWRGVIAHGWHAREP